jgi:hypothetical protein
MATLLEHIKGEWEVLSKAPLTFILLLAIGILSGVGIGEWRDSGQMASLREQVNQANGRISRYRVALGIDRPSQSALVELNNQELALKAQSIVFQLRGLYRALNEKTEMLNKQVKDGKLKKDQVGEQWMQIMKETSEAFDENLASDALNIENELRKRMTPEAMSHVVRVPAFVAGDSRVTFLGLMRGSWMEIWMVNGLANEIEQMYKLLPPDKG